MIKFNIFFLGQTLTRVGLALDRNQCFSHGQLYVALSRVKGEEYIRVLTPRPDNRVKNIVVREILDKDDINNAMKPGPDFPDDQVYFYIKCIIIFCLVS